MNYYSVFDLRNRVVHHLLGSHFFLWFMKYKLIIIPHHLLINS